MFSHFHHLAHQQMRSTVLVFVVADDDAFINRTSFSHHTPQPKAASDGSFALFTACFSLDLRSPPVENRGKFHPQTTPTALVKRRSIDQLRQFTPQSPASTHYSSIINSSRRLGTSPPRSLIFSLAPIR